MHKIKLITPENSLDFGQKVNQHLNKLYSTKNQNYLANVEFVRFNNGEGKCVVKDDLYGYDIYILCDTSNHNVSYDLAGKPHSMGPDEHIQDIKRAISALKGSAYRINIIMPLLYQSRQDKRKQAESLDCAMFLKELEWYGVKNLITVDIHNISVENAIPFNLTLHNETVVEKLLTEFKSSENTENLFVVSPDAGASKRAEYLAKILETEKSGFFEKRRNYNIVQAGQNPIEYHEFNGPDTLSGYNVLLVDDMIASGNSLLSSIKLLKNLHAEKIHLMTTFSLFTNGIDGFAKAHKDGLFDTLFTTNLSYIPKEYQEANFIKTVDCSSEIANSVYRLNTDF